MHSPDKEDNLAVVKGTGFSPHIQLHKNERGFSPEGMRIQIDPLPLAARA